jgi:cytochrome c peroxidase
MERLALGLWIALTVVTLAGYVGADNHVPAPRGFPTVPLPAGNLITEGRGNLGRRLSYDKQLSPTNDISCSSCAISFRN